MGVGWPHGDLSVMQVQQFNSPNLNAGLPMNASAFVGNAAMMGVSQGIAGANMWRQMASSLTCGGCQRIFQQPHTLYCGHHLCANCIDVVKNSGHATFRCPHRDCDKNISTKNPGVINSLLNELIQQTQRLCQVTPDGLAFQQSQMLSQRNANQHPGNSFGFETKTKSDFNENTTTGGVSMPIMNLLNLNGPPMPMQQNHQTQQGRPNQQQSPQSQMQQQQQNVRGMPQQPQPGPMQGGVVPPPLTAVGGGFNPAVWGGNAGNVGNVVAELSLSSNTLNATQDGDKDRLVLSPNQRKYIRYVVVVDPVTNAKYTVGIKHVLSTKGAQDLVAQLEKNINSEYKKGSCKAACTSVQPGMTCPMGRECAYVHVTPEGWKQRRRFSSANEKRKDAANAIAGTSPSPQNGFPGNAPGSDLLVALDQSQSQSTDSNSNTPPEPSFGLFGIGGLGDNTLLTGTSSVGASGSSHMPAFPASLQAAFPSSLSPSSSTPSANTNPNMLGPMLGGSRLFNTSTPQPLLGGGLNSTQSAPDYFRSAPDGGNNDIGGLGMLSLPHPSGQDYFPDDFWKNLDLNINASTEGITSGCERD